MSEQLQPIRLASPGQKGIPLMVVAFTNAGVVTAGRAMSVLLCWGIAERALGRELGNGEGISAAVREYTEWWKQSERTTWRDLRAFRKAFPSEESPAALAAQLREREVALKSVRKEPGRADVAAVGQLMVVA